MATQTKKERQDRVLCFNLSSFTRVVTLTCLQGLLRLRCLHLDWNLESDLDGDYDLRLGFQIEELEIAYTLLSLSQTFAGDYAPIRLLHSCNTIYRKQTVIMSEIECISDGNKGKCVIEVYRK